MKHYTEEKLRAKCYSGRPLIRDGKKYRVGLMSYGQYFLEPLWKRQGGETEGHDSETIWLYPIMVKNKYGTEVKRFRPEKRYI
jgi:hypothetical protein